MQVSFTEAVFLYSLHQIKAERSIYSLYHLFQGKKSSQTIQDAHLFKLTPFFQVYPALTREEVERTIGKLRTKLLLAEATPEHFELTIMGEEHLAQFCSQHAVPPKFLAGWRFHHLTNVFWERLTLLVQVCSNLIYQKKGFIPVQSKPETLEWVKAYLHKQKYDRYELASHLYHELVACLGQEDSINQSALVLRLTGHNQIGLTMKQTADRLQMESFHYHLEFLNTLHFLLDNVSNQAQYPCLNELINGVENSIPFTVSTEKTYELLKRGYGVDEIAHIRRLKKNTIEDHIVEIALHIKDFDISTYVSHEKEERIMKIAKEISTKKLRDIRQRVSDANYFEIRLVLARNGG